MTIIQTEKDTAVTSLEQTKANQDAVSLQQLRDAIPSRCFESSWTLALWYLSRDVCFAIVLATVSYMYIPTIPFTALRYLAWTAYGMVQGFLWTGLWVIGHEMGHGSTFPSQTANNICGFAIHSFFMTPYFAWRSTHRKHHRYSGHMEKDTDHVPKRFEDSIDPESRHLMFSSGFSKIDEYAEDAPLYVLVRLLMQQVLGWPLYLIFLIASGPQSYQYRAKSSGKSVLTQPAWLQKCQLNPLATLYYDDETYLILLSDIGIVAVAATIWTFGRVYGFDTAFLLYGQPYLWLNHWIVAITFLHHTHPEVPKYEAEAWTFIKGATATVDRDFGFIGRFFMHNIIDHHVVHHLFTRIPFYRAPEATAAIRPILGDSYHVDHDGFLRALWREFSTCQWVAPDDTVKAEDRALWFLDAAGQKYSTRQQQTEGGDGDGDGSTTWVGDACLRKKRLAVWW